MRAPLPDATSDARSPRLRSRADFRGTLLPGPPRRIPHARLLSVACRTVHLAAFGLLLGGPAWGVETDRLVAALWLTAGSGVALVVTESLAKVTWLLEGRGAMVLVKLALLLAVPFAWDHRVPLLLAVVVVASVGSHMPRGFRHRSLLSLWRARR